ncbi:histidine phosphatase family protein [Octadecabacter sp. 1_MG-2023]|uniref:histidine phosphatase family protein n=1 Tax=unclassified Octadecabacter TaxID=196158 RepID=UPI001C08B602|nr:histidine phosphatase family protein [Octadecabacter sp. 1_MG-2023]MBU2991829.1 histidine phosphatase family protein [Octadecabacter sp. B2R22]MDO6735803.1 histidine phosphatase family protein [Octadecabacter sp. 1_MG-2023]
MTVIFWVRHAPTHARSFVGHRDIPADLSDTAQIKRLTAALPQNALLVSSDLSRSIDTATALENGRTRLPHRAGLREFDFGDWDGMHFSDVAEKWPDLSRAYWETPGDIAPPNGESWNAAADRVTQDIHSVIAEHPRRDIIAVAHFGAILSQVQRAAGITPFRTLSHRIDNYSITEIQMRPTAGVARINHVP